MQYAVTKNLAWFTLHWSL